MCFTALFTCALYVFCSLSWIEVDGSTYKRGSVVLSVDETMPLFGIIEEIVFFTDVYYLVCSVLITEYHFHAFKTNKLHPEDLQTWCTS